MNVIRKFEESKNVTNYEVLTDEGFVDIKKSHKTIPYEIWHLELANRLTLLCADTHIVFNESMEEIFVKDLKPGVKIQTIRGLSEVTIVENTHNTNNTDSIGWDITTKDNMYDLELDKKSNHRYFTNDILSHNTDSIRRLMGRLIPNVTFVIPNFSTNEDLKTIMAACEVFTPGCIVFDDIDLFLGSRDNGSYTRMLGDFLTFFDGIKKRKISLLASTNDKNLVDKAAERPGRFNLTLDFSFLDNTQLIEVCKIHLPEEWQVDEVYSELKNKDITGAFIANLAENIREMSAEDKEWDLKDTIFLIKESYNGFYNSQVNKKEALGFKTNSNY